MHIQSGAKPSTRSASPAFFSQHGPRNLPVLGRQGRGTLYFAELPVAYTEPRLAAWISSNFAAATYAAETNELDVTYDGVRLILNDAELRQRFPGTGPYPLGASPSKPCPSITCWAPAASRAPCSVLSSSP